ncbi:zinc finger BED domain-containing protein 5-like [Oratosquilla oratoria]|uniref:zinc finger BED domain-containing protein 5-like n=1 Tax=Oratosquilla oratoria TaxID=337810 RepID=UPI003F7585A0
MDNFVIRKSVKEASENEVMVDEPDQVSPSGIGLKRKNAKSSKSKPQQLSQDGYLTHGFTWCDEHDPKLKCIICGFQLSSGAMVPSKMKRHLIVKHKHLSNKPVSYFKRLLNENNKQRLGSEEVDRSEKVLKASYRITELIAKSGESREVAESLVLPSCWAMVRALFGPEAENEVKKIQILDDTIMKKMSSDQEKAVDSLPATDGETSKICEDVEFDVAGNTNNFIKNSSSDSEEFCHINVERKCIKSEGNVDDYIVSKDWEFCEVKQELNEFENHCDEENVVFVNVKEEPSENNI